MQELLQKKIAETLSVPLEQVSITVPEIAEFGHYSTNVAMRLFAERKKHAPASTAGTPLVLAEEFAQKLKAAAPEMFADVKAVKPGFINFWISEKFLSDEFAKGDVAQNIGEGKKVIVEYASCNIAKPMHVGHLRSTIIGDALANIHAYLGYDVIRWNYIGDWGTQFGKLIYAYKNPLQVGSTKGITKENLDARIKAKPIETLLDLYVGYHEYVQGSKSDIGLAIENGARAEFKKLEEGDAENRKLLEWFKAESLVAFNALFARLGVKFDIEYGEAFYEKALAGVNAELAEKKLSEQSEGAVIVNLDKFKLPPALVQKGDGASLYLTRDIANLEYRLKEYKPAKILLVVANQQALHFEQLFAVAQLLGLTGSELQHVKFGMVLGPDGKKFATREGKLIKLEELLDEVTAKAMAVVSRNNAEMPPEQAKAIAEMVGIGALKYNDLKENRNSDITFNWEAMLDLHGDSAPYLQYAAVRFMNIIRKAGEVGKGDISMLTDELAMPLIKKVLDFNDVVQLCAQTYYTSHLAKYLFELAKLGNQYYESVRILDDENVERKKARLLLIDSVAQTITKGLGLLGITVPERI